MTQTNADLAYQLIKEKIISIEMRPGSIISESRLMEQLNLGRTPIREALKQLEADRLVVAIPHRGTFVTDIQITDLQQIYEIRVYLEQLAARLAAERATEDDIAELESCCWQMSRPSDIDIRQLIMIDCQFHKLLAQAAHNKFLMGEAELFYNLSLRLWHLSLHRVTSTDLDTNRHLVILQAIKDRDSGRAEELMRQHIQCFHEVIRAVL